MLAIDCGPGDVHRSQAAKAAEAANTARRAGYRYIDTTIAYRDEREVRIGIRVSDVAGEKGWVSVKL